MTSDFSHLFADALSIITISMCLFLKVPQIRSILKAKNARGISAFGLILELTSYSITTLYNYVNKYAILSYMEYPILIAQEYVLVYLVLSYQQLLGTKAIALIIIYFGLVVSFITGLLNGKLINFLMPFCTPITLSSKSIQLWVILSKQNADSVSVTTWVISSLTNGSRIYTIYLDSADLILLTNFTLSTLMSCSIALSAYILQSKKEKKL